MTKKLESFYLVCSSESTNPDVLGSIFQGLDSLHSSSAQVTRGGKILTTANQSPTKGSSSSNVKSSKDKLTTCEDEMKLESDMEIKRTSEEEKYLKTLDNSSNKPDVAKHLRQDQRSSDEQCSSGNIFEKLSSSRTADLHSGSCYKPSDTKQRAKTSSSPSTSLKSGLSPPSTPVSSKSTLSGFRIPKRNSKSQDEPNQTSLSSGNSPIHVKQETSSSISNFKIPKRTNSMSGGDSSRDESSKVNIAKPANVKCSGQKLMSSVSGVEQNLPLSHYTSSSKGITHSGCVTESKSAGSSLAYSNRVRPFVHETLQRRNSLNSSTTAYEGSVTSASNAIRNHAKTISSNSTISGTSISTSLSHAEAGPVRKTNSSSVTRYPTKNVSSITPSHTTTTINRTAQSVTSLSSETACHAKKVSNFPRSHTKTSNSVTPLTKVAPLIDHLKPVGGKEQRRSNIEIIKMLQEKQKSIRDQLSGDSSHSGHSGMTDTGELPKKVIPVSDKTPTCSREVTLPVAIVKPSRQMPSVTVNAPSSLPSSSLESSPVKSIASGIINAHSCNAQEFKRVRSESDPVGSGLKRSSSHTEREAKARKHEGLGTGADGNRDQQRKSVRI